MADFLFESLIGSREPQKEKHTYFQMFIQTPMMLWVMVKDHFNIKITYSLSNQTILQGRLDRSSLIQHTLFIEASDEISWFSCFKIRVTE